MTMSSIIQNVLEHPCCCWSVTRLCLTLGPHGLQHARFPCPSLSPGICLNSCASSRWCHPTISSSVTSFSFCPQSFPASGSFPIGRIFISSSRSIGASASVLPMNISFRINWFDLLAAQGTLKSFPTSQFKSINSLAFSLLYGPTLTSIHDYWKNHSFDYMDLCKQSDASAF